jgi:hypothetical protein
MFRCLVAVIRYKISAASLNYFSRNLSILILYRGLIIIIYRQEHKQLWNIFADFPLHPKNGGLRRSVADPKLVVSGTDPAGKKFNFGSPDSGSRPAKKPY